MAKPLVTDALWQRIEPLLPPPKPRRRRYPGRAFRGFARRGPRSAQRRPVALRRRDKPVSQHRGALT